MKIIAFLCCVIVFGLQGVLIEASSGDVYAVLDSEVVVKRVDNGSYYHLEIKVEGAYNFQLNYGDEDHRYYVNNVTTDGDHFIFYGYLSGARGTRHHHGYVLFVDGDGLVLSEDVFEFSDVEEVAAHYWLGDQLVFQVKESDVSTDKYVEVGNYFVFFGKDFLRETVVNFEYKFNRVDVDNDVIYLAKEYHGSYDMAIDKFQEVYQGDIVYGLVNHGVYEESVSFYFINPLVFEGEVYRGSLEISYPGLYQLTYQGKQYQFTVNPVVSGIEVDGIYNQAVSFSVSSGRVLLNGELVVENEPVVGPGKYVVEVEGLNEYTVEIPFMITSQLQGVYHEQVYKQERQLTFFGRGFLNSQYIESGIIVSEPGHYTLEIYGDYDYKETVYFQIVETEDTGSASSALFYAEIALISSALLVGGGLLLRMRLKG